MDDICYFTPIPLNQTAKGSFETKQRVILEAFAHISDESLLLTPFSVLSCALTTQFRLEPLTIKYDLLTVSSYMCASDSRSRSSEKKMQVILLHLPYLGSVDMLASITVKSCPMQAAVKGRLTDQEVIVELNNTRRESDWLKVEKRRVLDLVASVVAWCNREIASYNQGLSGFIEPLINARISRIQAEQHILQENQQMLLDLREPYIPPPISLPLPFESPSCPSSHDDRGDYWDDDD